jgi:hypothetical protein
VRNNSAVACHYLLGNYRVLGKYRKASLIRQSLHLCAAVSGKKKKSL